MCASPAHRAGGGHDYRPRGPKSTPKSADPWPACPSSRRQPYSAAFTASTSPTGENMSIQRFEVGPRMSQAVVHGNTVYLAGQVANNPAPTVAKQTKQILSQIDKLLKQAGSRKSKLLSANI